MFRPNPKPIKNLLKKIDKKTKVKKLIEELDEVFSVYIRTLDINPNGFGSCFTCGKMDHWSKLQCGHFFSRRYFGTRWEELNAAPQCISCNLFNQGDGPNFARNLVKIYGPEILDKLTILKNRTVKLNPFELEIQIKHYRKLIQEAGVNT